MKLFVGLDVSLEKTAVCVISEHGKIVKEAQVASEPEALLRWISDQDGAIAAVGLEAGPLSQWLHRGLSEAGLPVVLMETRQVKGALKAMPIKTDRRDAEGIARLLHLGWFRPVHCKSVSAQEVRAVLSARKAVQQGFITLEMSLRGLLRNFGLKVGTISRGRFEQRIRELAAGKPMQLAFLSSVMRSEVFPPADPWLSGYAISYYYFGYVIAGMLSLLSGISSTVGSNMTSALLFALTPDEIETLNKTTLAWRT